MKYFTIVSALSHVKVQGGISEWFQVGKEVRQRCAMSLPPWLFIVHMDHILWVANERFSRGVKLLDDKNVQFLFVSMTMSLQMSRVLYQTI